MGNDLGTDDNNGEVNRSTLIFFMCLTVNSSSTLSFHFMFSPSVVTIGFSGTYSVREDAGSINISVLVLMNFLARDVVVTLSTVDGTARGGFAQCVICMDHY